MSSGGQLEGKRVGARAEGMVACSVQAAELEFCSLLVSSSLTLFLLVEENLAIGGSMARLPPRRQRSPMLENLV